MSNSYPKTWSSFVSRNAKAVVATLTPAVALGTSLALTLPANIAAPITVGVSAVTGFITWLTANTESFAEIAGSTEELAENIAGEDL